MKQLMTLTRLNLLMVARNPQAVGFGVAFPLIMMLFWGYIGRHGQAQATFGGEGTVAYTGFLMVGLMVTTIVASGIPAYGFVTAQWREAGILRRVRCTPLPVWRLLLARMLVQIAITAAGAAGLVAVAVGLFGVRLTPATAPFGTLVALLAIVLFTGIGQLIASVARRAETALAIGNLVYLPLLLLGGLFIKIEAFPPALQRVVQWSPVAVVGDLLRPALLQGSFGPHPLRTTALLLGYLAVVLGLAARFFDWDEA
ncbi:MAG: ABC transporter permease [Chloroflexota bacterium]|nr:ABC transporter permease [Chloroflexota bacterium]